METLLTARQLQELLQVDRMTIYRMLKDGRLQGFKVGGQWRFSREKIETWLRERQADLGVAESPLPVAGDLAPSAQTLPLSCVEAMQGILAEALGVGAVTTAVDGTPLTPVSNSCAFCDLILGSQAGRQRCITSWREGTCHARLRCVGGRIAVQGEFVALFYAGQFLDRPPNGDSPSEWLTGLAAATGLDAAALHEAWRRVPVLDEAQSRKLPRLVQRVADTFSEIGEERLGLLNRLQRIAEITSLA